MESDAPVEDVRLKHRYRLSSLSTHRESEGRCEPSACPYRGRFEGEAGGARIPSVFLNGKELRAQRISRFLIPFFDIALSCLMFVFFTPAMLIVAILIRITSRGPVLYAQERVGKGGKVFTLYKFRTMIHDAERCTGPTLASENDPCVTQIGRFLRATRFDELPQLYNVLRGDMSIVGPRPERPHFVEQYRCLQGLRLTVKRG